MIIPKTLNRFYMLTQGNILYLIANVGYKRIEPRKATIREIICTNTLEPQDFVMVLEVENSYMRNVLEKYKSAKECSEKNKISLTKIKKLIKEKQNIENEFYLIKEHDYNNYFDEESEVKIAEL